VVQGHTRRITPAEKSHATPRSAKKKTALARPTFILTGSLIVRSISTYHDPEPTTMEQLAGSLCPNALRRFPAASTATTIRPTATPLAAAVEMGTLRKVTNRVELSSHVPDSDTPAGRGGEKVTRRLSAAPSWTATRVTF
jgi:hypothetical protein